MTAYYIALLRVHDRETYERYVADVLPLILRHGGRVLAADYAPRWLEGPRDADRVVLLAFEDPDSARRLFESAEYQSLAENRRRASESSVLCVQGLDPGADR
ncbi:MAG TPA: DUF1330 domain-containing protein [Longimicrobium sp.]|jgi:uncharacterized protein (DUF1330 family)